MDGVADAARSDMRANAGEAASATGATEVYSLSTAKTASSGLEVASDGSGVANSEDSARAEDTFGSLGAGAEASEYSVAEEVPP